MSVTLCTRVTRVDVPYLAAFLQHYASLAFMNVVLLVNHAAVLHDDVFLQTVQAQEAAFPRGICVMDGSADVDHPDTAWRRRMPAVQQHLRQLLSHSSTDGSTHDHWVLCVDTDEYLWLDEGRTMPAFLAFKRDHHFAAENRYATIAHFQFPWILVDCLDESAASPRALLQQWPWYVQRPRYHVKSMVRLAFLHCMASPHHFATPPHTTFVLAGHIHLPAHMAEPFYNERQWSVDYSTVPVVLHLQTLSLWNLALKLALHNLYGKSGPSERAAFWQAIHARDVDALQALYKVRLCCPNPPDGERIAPRDLSTFSASTGVFNAACEAALRDEVFPNAADRAFLVRALRFSTY